MTIDSVPFVLNVSEVVHDNFSDVRRSIRKRELENRVPLGPQQSS